MKKLTKKMGYTFMLLMLLMTSAIYSYGQDADNSYYTPSKPAGRHLLSDADGMLPYLAYGTFAIILIMMGYVIIHTWYENRHDNDINHTPHHQ